MMTAQIKVAVGTFSACWTYEETCIFVSFGLFQGIKDFLATIALVYCYFRGHCISSGQKENRPWAAYFVEECFFIASLIF